MSIGPELLRGVHHRLEAAFRDALADVEVETRRAAPYRTGYLESRIEARVVSGSPPTLEGEIEADTAYAGYTDAGTRGPYVIMPRSARVLSWVDAAGDRRFARSVVHPGIRPGNWFTGGRDAGEPLATRWREALQRALA